jgi:hypothetical protein
MACDAVYIGTKLPSFRSKPAESIFRNAPFFYSKDWRITLLRYTDSEIIINATAYLTNHTASQRTVLFIFTEIKTSYVAWVSKTRCNWHGQDATLNRLYRHNIYIYTKREGERGRRNVLYDIHWYLEQGKSDTAYNSKFYPKTHNNQVWLGPE